ncbi:MAG: LysR substrate-binding domain-containing protein [Alphaproteobacteria bacterium]|nr:LysR substrate-binding domain-containing protein [Alphaproteobacteria bacterium]
MLTILQLQRFVAVAEELSFRKAAARLRVSQPSLSESIRQLEEELDTQLLMRSRQSVEITKSGLIFLERARLILSQINEAAGLTRAISQGMSGHIAVGFNPTASYDVLPSILRRYHERFPTVSVGFEELPTAEQQDALHQKRIDVAFFLAPAVAKRGVRQEIFWKEPLTVVLSEDHPLSRKSEICLGELRHERFVFLPSRQGTGYQARVLYACQEAGFAPNVVHQVDRVHNLVSLVAAGMGIALCPSSLRRFEPPGVAFRRLKDASSLFYVEFGIACREDDRSALTASMISVAREIGRASNQSGHSVQLE